MKTNGWYIKSTYMEKKQIIYNQIKSPPGKVAFLGPKQHLHMLVNISSNQS